MNRSDDSQDDDDMMLLIAPEISASTVPGAMRQRLRHRLDARLGDSLRRHAGLLTLRGRDGSWDELMSGVHSKLLWQTDGGSSVLIRLDPGAALPVHRHRFLEEGLVLTGGMQMGELDLGPGDYHVSAPGSRHDRIGSRQGCLTYLRGTSVGSSLGIAIELLGGLVPGAGAAPVTITRNDGQWQAIADGVAEKRLWREGRQQSRFIRFAPGSTLPGHDHALNEENLVIEGDVFFGDILVRQQEFHVAPAGTRHDSLSSDTGALIFVHGDCD